MVTKTSLWFMPVLWQWANFHYYNLELGIRLAVSIAERVWDKKYGYSNFFPRLPTVYTEVIELAEILGKPHPVLTDIPLLDQERERFWLRKKRW